MEDRPADALLAVTYRCNARCTMCNIWRTQPQEELTARSWSNIPSELRDVNISGGEPFLRDDLPEIVRVVRARCPQARIIISSNGLGPERIGALMDEVLEADPRIGVGISIDGMEGVHDRIRGVKGGYAQAVETVHLLKRRGVRDLRIAFTAIEGNSGQMERVYRLSRELGVEFSCSVAHDSDIYFKISGTRLSPADTLQQELRSVALSELLTLVPKRWERSYFYKGLADYIRTSERALPCMAGRVSLFIDPTGEVYPCNILDLAIGNIGSEPFDRIWCSERAEEVRREVAQCSRPCWMMCSVRPVIRANLVKAGLWVAGNKVRAHIGRGWTP